MFFCFLTRTQDGWSSIHYAIWGLARSLGLCGKQEEFTAKDVAKALEVFNHLLHHGSNTKVCANGSDVHDVIAYRHDFRCT